MLMKGFNLMENPALCGKPWLRGSIKGRAISGNHRPVGPAGSVGVHAGLVSPQVPMPGLPAWTRGQAVTTAQTDPAHQGVLPWGGERPPLPWSEMWALNPGKTWAGAGEDSILLTLRNTVSVLCALVPAPGHLPAQLLTQDGAQASLMAVPTATGRTAGHQVPQTPLGAGTGTYLEHESFPGTSAQAKWGTALSCR